MNKNQNTNNTIVRRIAYLRELIRKASIAGQWPVVERAERELISLGGKL